MKVLIEFFDNTILKNLTGVISIKPDVAAFFYDKKGDDHKRALECFDACKRYVPGLRYELIGVDYSNINEVGNRLSQYLDENINDEMIIDVTGGSDIVHFAAFHIAKEKNRDILYSDIPNGRIRGFGKEDYIFSRTPVDIDTLVTGVQGRIISQTDEKYLLKNKDALEATGRVLLSNINQWSQACYYFQKKMEYNRETGSYHFRSKGQGDVPSVKIMEAFADTELIKNYSYNNARLEFNIKDNYIMDSLTTFGVWLELHTYFAALQIPELSDVRTSIKIDWYRKDANENVDNELDVTAIMGLRPVIMSCKSSEKAASAEALNELYVVSRRLGGEYSIPVLVSLADTRGGKFGLRKKGREMGITVIGEEEILSKDFPDILIKKITENKKGFF